MVLVALQVRGDTQEADRLLVEEEIDWDEETAGQGTASSQWFRRTQRWRGARRGAVNTRRDHHGCRYVWALDEGVYVINMVLSLRRDPAHCSYFGMHTIQAYIHLLRLEPSSHNLQFPKQSMDAIL
ncbi:hypothetical protein FIBSPDRAFT_876172 [Athelia psychrophila]|uniref:Uncharacterized protein n=1 Tax=Athelia psychrophila TaxID=1759441 RepID=A0A167X564_9AGAM|nr:hypothetical protein FIBSPDRAFT_876172 [Fibularhizoctonia sp. CBS 109695]